MDEIWAVLEYNNSTFQEQGGELLSELVDIAIRQPEPAKVCAVILCSPHAELPDVEFLSHIGVQQLYVLEHAHLLRYSTGGYASAMAWLIEQREPVLVATSASLNGRDWMPRLASRLRLQYVPNCLSLVVQNDALFAIRSIYEGRAYVQTCTTLKGRTAL